MKHLKKWFDSAQFREEFHTDVPLGAQAGESGTRFALWAPTAQHVWLRLFDNGTTGEPVEFIELFRGEKGVWTHADSRNLHGMYYQYDVTVDGVCRTCGDPYARACGVNGQRSMVLDLRQTDPAGWEKDCAPKRPAENIIYELHVKDFTWDVSSGVSEGHRGKYLAFCEENTTLHGDGTHPTGVAYLRDLGVTHVQLMPVYDYGSVDEAGAADQFNWGYDPMNYNIPEGSYATDPYRGEVRVRELKQAIMSLHKSGLRVIMDVVYNHTYNTDTCLQMSVPGYYYRQNPQGRFSNGSGCGNEIASERSMAARYILESVLYWAEEYHIDGFRFDLMGLEDTGLMNRIRKALDRRFGRGEKLLYGEPWAGGKAHPRPGTRLAHKGNLKLLHKSVGAFCDATRDAVKGSVFEEKAGGFVSGGAFDADWLARCMKAWVGSEGFPVKAPSQTISYLSCHDDLTLWDKLVITLDEKRAFDAPQADVLRANRLAAAIIYCCQGNMFMLSGEEMGRTKMGDHNSFRSPLAINRFDWNRAWAKEYRELALYYKGLIALRKQLPALCDKSEKAGSRVLRAWEEKPRTAVVEMDNRGRGSRWKRLLVIVNTGRDVANVLLPEGEWQALCCGENSSVWQEKRMLCGSATLTPVSALILGGNE